MLAEQVTDWTNNVLAFLEANNIDENNVDYTSTDGIVVMGQTQTITGAKTFTSTLAAAGGVRTAITVAVNPASGTATDDDGVGIAFVGDDDAGVATTYATEQIVFADTAAAGEDAEWVLNLILAGVLTEALAIRVSAGGFFFLQFGTMRIWDGGDAAAGIRVLWGSDPALVTDGVSFLQTGTGVPGTWPNAVVQ